MNQPPGWGPQQGQYGQPPPGYPPQVGYPPQGYGQPSFEKNSTASTAMWVGIASIFCGVAWPFALYLGLKAKKEIAAQPGRYSNGGEATVGVVLGSIFGVLFVLGIAFAIIAIAMAPHAAPIPHHR
jgi:hypothetical protein